MRSLTDGLLGIISGRNYRLEVWKMSAPKRAASSEPWVYITKIDHSGEIGDKSIGLPATDLPGLISILAHVLRES